MHSSQDASDIVADRADLDPELAAGLAASPPTLPYARQVFWAGLPTACGLPSTAVPVAPPTEPQDENDLLPTAFQVVGPAWVSCHDIAGIWVAFLEYKSARERCRCGQGDETTLDFAAKLAAHCAGAGTAEQRRVGLCAVPRGFE